MKRPYKVYHTEDTTGSKWYGVADTFGSLFLETWYDDSNTRKHITYMAGAPVYHHGLKLAVKHMQDNDMLVPDEILACLKPNVQVQSAGKIIRDRKSERKLWSKFVEQICRQNTQENHTQP